MNNTIKIIENGEYKAYVSKFTPLGKWNGEYSVLFCCYGSIDYQIRGGCGTGSKEYSTLEKAMAAAKRYVNKYNKRR